MLAWIWFFEIKVLLRAWKNKGKKERMKEIDKG